MKRLALLICLLAATVVFAQQPINVTNIGGTAVSTGNGTTNAGDIRVNIASDNTAFQVKVTGNAGAAFDAAQGAAAPANVIQEGGVFNTVLPTIGAGDLSAIQLDPKGQQFMDLNYVNGAAIVLGNGTNAGAIRVTIASDNTAFPVNATLQTGANTVGKFDLLGNAGAIMDFAGQNAASPANALLIGGQFNTSPTTITSGNVSPFQLDSSGKLLVNCTGCSAGSTVSLIPATTGGLTFSHLITAATNNATSLKATAGQVYGACVYNNTTYPVFLKFYNKASAPTPGTDTIVFNVPAQAGTERCFQTEEGAAFATGIAYAVTKGITDADNTSVALSDASIDIVYK